MRQYLSKAKMMTCRLLGSTTSPEGGKERVTGKLIHRIAGIITIIITGNEAGIEE